MQLIKYAICILMMALFLSACSSDSAPINNTSNTKHESVTGIIPETTASKNTSEPYDPIRTGINVTFAETEDCYYWLPYFGDRIHYYEKAAGFSGPLCFKPACRHDDQQCDAYVGIILCGSLVVREGMLYWIGSGIGDSEMARKSYGIWRMKTDGTDRELFGQMDYDELNKYQYQVGYLWGDHYYIRGEADTYYSDDTSEIAYRISFLRIPVSGGAARLLGEYTAMPAHSRLLLGPGAVYFWIYGNMVLEDPVQESRLSILKWDMVEEKTEIILDRQEMKAYTSEVRLHPDSDQGIIIAPGVFRSEDPDYPGDPMIYRLQDGKLLPWMDFSESIFDRVYVMAEGLLLIHFRDEKYPGTDQSIHEYELLDMNGHKVSSGTIPVGFLDIDSDSQTSLSFRYFYGGIRQFFVEADSWGEDGGNVFHLIRYDVMPDGLQETKLMQYNSKLTD